MWVSSLVEKSKWDQHCMDAIVEWMLKEGEIGEQLASAIISGSFKEPFCYDVMMYVNGKNNNIKEEFERGVAKSFARYYFFYDPIVLYKVQSDSTVVSVRLFTAQAPLRFSS